VKLLHQYGQPGNQAVSTVAALGLARSSPHKWRQIYGPSEESWRGPKLLAKLQRFRDYIKPMSKQLHDTKAVKSDDATVPVHLLWDNQITFLLGTQSLGIAAHRAVNLLRHTQLRWWKCNVYSSWWAWWRENHQSVKQ